MLPTTPPCDCDSDEETVLIQKQILKQQRRIEFLEAKLKPDDEEGDEGHEDKVSMYGDDEGDDGHEGKVSTGDECDAGHEGKVSRKWHPYLKQFVDVAGVDDDDDGDEDHEGQVSMDDAGDEDHEGKVSMDDCGDGDHSMVDDGGVAAAQQDMREAMFADELEEAFMEGKERAAEGWDTEVDEAWVESAKRGWDTDEDEHLGAVAEVVAMAAEEAGDDDGHDEEEATI